MTQVLITRPLVASQQLAASLDTLGLQAIIMPLYTFHARSPEMDFRAVWQAGRGRKLAVFTSPRAVQFGLEYLAPGVAAELEFAAVGPATRRALEAAGHAVTIQAPAGYTSEDLLQLPTLAGQAGTAVIFAAPGGRETLARGLTHLGWHVSRAMVYARCALAPGPAQLEAIRNAAHLISLWTSISAVTLAAEKLPNKLWQKILRSPILVISSRIEHHLQQLGGSRIHRANGPGNRELLQLIRHLIEQNGQTARER